MARWSKAELAILAKTYQCSQSMHEVSRLLGRSVHACKSRAHKLGFVRRPLWTESERAVVRRLYRKVPIRVIATQLGRTLSQVHQQARRLGLTRTGKSPLSAEAKQRLAELVREGRCNRCIGRELDRGRKEIRNWRRRLGLPELTARGMVDSCLTCKERTRAKTRQQIREAGVKSLADIRVLAFRKFARESGWPEDLRPRAVQILNALYARGPMTRQQIAAAVGMPWRGSRPSLSSNDPEGSYLAHLANRGLVTVLKRGKKVVGQGRGKSVDLYAIPLNVTPNLPEQTP